MHDNRCMIAYGEGACQTVDGESCAESSQIDRI